MASFWRYYCSPDRKAISRYNAHIINIVTNYTVYRINCLVSIEISVEMAHNNSMNTQNNKNGNGNSAIARDSAYKKLRQMLICSSLRPGTKLAEIEWAERFGVHRGAMREAMAILLHEGLLVRSGRSFAVPILQDEDIREIYQVRGALEMTALWLCADKQLSDSDLAPLESLCQTMDHLLAVDLPLGFSEADEKFHTELIALSGNKRLMHVYRLAPFPHSKYGGNLPADLNGVLDKAQIEHRGICEALRNGHPHDAACILEEHLSVRWLENTDGVRAPKFTSLKNAQLK